MANGGDNLGLIRKHGLPKLVGEGQQFPLDFVSPNGLPESYWRRSFIIALVAEPLINYSIDSTRVHLTGLNIGDF